jgi:hypothetical protein
MILPDIDLAEFIDDSSNYQIFSKKIKVLNPLTMQVVYEFNRYIKADNDFIYLLGKWVGDGWYQYNKHKRKYNVGFAFNSNDSKEIKKTIEFFKKLNYKVGVAKSKNKQLTQVYVYNKLLASWFKSYFDKYQSTSRTKHLKDLKYLLKDQLKVLIKGLISADGSVSISKYRQETISTTSPILLEDLKIAFMNLGIPVNISERKPYLHGKYITRTSYTLKFIGLTLPRKSREYLIREDGYFSKITKIEKTSPEPVFDLMIGGDPSYTTVNFTVHNSGAGSLVAYALDITDCDPIHFDLLFERFLTKERVGKLNFEIPGFPMSEYSKDKKE